MKIKKKKEKKKLMQILHKQINVMITTIFYLKKAI